MRIAFLVHEFPTLSETFIINQAVGLIKRGHQVDIYAEKQGDIDHLQPLVKQYNLLERTYYLLTMPENLFERGLKGINLLRKYLTLDRKKSFKSLDVWRYGLEALSFRLIYMLVPQCEQPYDIIHCQFGTQGYRGIWFRKINSPQANLITTFRGQDISKYVEEKGTHVYDKLFKEGNYFLTNCDFFKQRIIALGCDPNLISVLRSGLNYQQFIFKPRFLEKNQKICIATTGRLVEKKGIEYSIRAVAKQAEITPNLKYNIIGDGELRPHLEQLIKTLKMQNIIQLVGWKNEQEIKEILDNSHIFIAPSVTAKDGNQDAPINVLKEAMAMGLPVISTYHGGIPELVEDGVSGYLVPERDVDALADKLNLLIQHPEQWKDMGKAGRDYVEKHYDLDKLNDNLVDIYQQVLNSNQTLFNLNLNSVTLSS
ncbi:glycosyltransferase [Cyanothece sp. BG0011]|uniref:glycosyltransferase n=1 Tax=Cyanothece sp. BG0011 TaxID=2082950 RepID=UPI000D1F8F9F|nr:glycosyltransferase [Cyanothece sp. BG0011]